MYVKITIRLDDFPHPCNRGLNLNYLEPTKVKAYPLRGIILKRILVPTIPYPLRGNFSGGDKVL